MDTSSQSDYEALKVELVEKCDTEYGIGGNYIYYMATPPSLIRDIFPSIYADAGLFDQTAGFRRIIIEKPFGYDLESPKKLNKHVHRLASEDQIFRIDHYLGQGNCSESSCYKVCERNVRAAVEQELY